MTARAAKAKKQSAAKTARPVAKAEPLRASVSDLPSMDEPALRDMLKDPIMQRLMSSDGITRNQLLTLVAAARNRMRCEQPSGYSDPPRV